MDIDAINDPKNDLNQSLINALTGMEALLYDPLLTVIYLFVIENLYVFKIIISNLNYEFL